MYSYPRIKRLQTESREAAKDTVELYSERLADLERLEKYLSKLNVVGVNGKWGSGKTVLVDHYTRYKENCEVIKVEPLTCNMDTIDVYLFEQLECVLRRNRIYPRYSRKVQRVLSDNSWGKQIYNILSMDAIDQVTAFQGFCQDLEKLDKEVLVIYEDIDRISAENQQQIAKLFDLSEKLLSHKVKVIYEFDVNKMADLGFNREYLEKYVPYIMNLTDIPLKKMVTDALRDLHESVADLNWNDDFRFLLGPVSAGFLAKKKLNISGFLEYKVNNVTPRLVKVFVSEIDAIMQQPEYAKKENRKTVIAFFFMKHFFEDLYQEFSGCEDLLSEMKFACHREKSEEIQYYSIVELIEKNWDTKDFIFENNDENNCKLSLLLLLGYVFEYAREEDDEEQNRRKQSGRKRELNNEQQKIANMEHNEKISRIICNLYRNGKSEYTNAESVAIKFIKDVLLKDRECWLKEWNNYRENLFQGDVYKDNQTVFKLGIDEFPLLFRVLWIYFSKESAEYEKEEIYDKTLDFYETLRPEENELTLEKITMFRFYEPSDRKVYFRILRLFNKSEIVDNFKGDESYKSFLINYSAYAFRQGYLMDYDPYILKGDLVKGENAVHFIKKFIIKCQRDIITLPDVETLEIIKEELEVLQRFCSKNLEIVNYSGKGSTKNKQGKSNWKHIRQYTDKEAFEELKKEMEKVGNTDEISEELRARLYQKYAEGKINLREYRELLGTVSNEG